jgi:hypothetical protein
MSECHIGAARGARNATEGVPYSAAKGLSKAA